MCKGFAIDIEWCLMGALARLWSGIEGALEKGNGRIALGGVEKPCNAFDD